MRAIVPGGYYSYDSEGKKIWLDYQYYGTTLENIEKIKNLTRNKILYDCKRSTVLPTVENGCITHSYPGNEADEDKIQVTLRTPITNSLTELEAVDGVVTLSTDGKVLVLPTANAAILPSYNDRVLDPNRLTVAESPFGGLKGSGSPDYCPGTLFCQTDGVYLTDTSGTNSTKTLTAGKLKELNLLTVNTTAHTITEEFIVTNTGTSNNPTVIDACDSTAGWSIHTGTGEISLDDGVKCTASSSSGSIQIKKLLPSLTGKHYSVLVLRSSINTTIKFGILSTGAGVISWSVRNFPITANTDTTYIFPILAPIGSTGMSTGEKTAFDPTKTCTYFIGITTPDNVNQYSFIVKSLKDDIAKTATIEAQVPDNLSATSLSLYTHNGTAYQLCSTHSLDGAYSQVSQTSANCTFLDSTKLDDVYGTGLGRAVFPKGSAAATVNGSTGSITYSNNLGTDKRIGLTVNLPPSDNGRTNFNKVRAKLVINYTDTVGNIVPDLSGNNNTGTIVGGVVKLNTGGLKLDGSTGYVNCGTSIKLSPSTAITIAATVIPETGFGQAIANKKQANSGYALELFPTSVQFRVGNGTSDSIASGAVTATIGTAHKIVGIYDGSLTKIYFDGILIDTTPGSGSVQSVVSALTIGYSIGAAGQRFKGTILKYAQYNRAWASDEILAYQNEQTIDATNLVINYIPTVSNMGSTTHDFADSTNTSYGLQNLSKPWVALYDPADSLIDFYLFTHRPQNLTYKRDETGTIYSLSLYPGAGSVYHGQIPFSDLTLDSDSNSVPDCLEASINGSVTKFLQNYTMVI